MELESTSEHTDSALIVSSEHSHTIEGFSIHFILVGVLIAMLVFAAFVANKARQVGLSYSANVATIVVLISVALTFLLGLIDELYPFGFDAYHIDHILPIIGTFIFVWLFSKSRKPSKTLKEIHKK